MLRDGLTNGVEQFTKPYIHAAIGAQKLLNFSIQTLGNEVENMMQHKLMAPKEGIPPAYADAYTNYQQASVLIYNAFKNDDPNIPLPPPQAIPRVPMPQEVNQAISISTSIIQNVLGSYDAQQGNVGNQLLSGKALQAGATQSNMAAMPYVVNFLKALNRLAQLTLEMIPKYYNTPRTIPVLDMDGKRSYKRINQKGGVNLEFDPSVLDVRVEAGVNFQVQHDQALDKIVQLANAMPTFGQFINSIGLDVLVDNLEIYGQDRLKALVPKFQEQQQQQQQMAMQQMQNNPQVMMAKTKAMQVQLQGQKQMQDAQYNQAKLQADTQQQQIDNVLRAQEIQNERMETEGALQQNQQDNIVQLEKSETEKLVHQLDAALALAEHHRTHNREDLKLVHSMKVHKDEMAQNESVPTTES
jgi:hypothetical protein